MSTIGKFAVRDVAIATFFDLVTGELKAKLDTLKQSGLENTASLVYARGGRGNPKLVGFSGDKEVKFTLEDALWDLDLISMFTGNDVATGATKVQKDEVLPVTTNTANLTFTPAATGKLISVNKVNADGTKGEVINFKSSTPSTGEYSITGKVITFGATTFTAGESVMVYYFVNSGVGAKTIKNTTDKFAGSYRLVLDCLVRDLATKKDFAAQITVGNAKFDDSSWNFAMAAEGDPATFNIPLEALKDPKSNDLYTMVIYDEDDIV